MYKRITHNIVEEHFDSPIASQIKSSIERSFRSPRLRAMPGVPNDQIFDKDRFRSDMIGALNGYGMGINAMIDALTLPESELVKEFESIFTNIDTIGNMTKPFFPSELGERINVAMRYAVVYIMMMIHTEKLGQDTGWMFNRLSQNSIELANALNAFNTSWNSNDILAFLNSLNTKIKDRMTAKTANNTSVDATLKGEIAGQYISLANLIADGIINKFPSRFITAPMTGIEWPCPTPTPSA